jgi:hypothetical protein
MRFDRGERLIASRPGGARVGTAGSPAGNRDDSAKTGDWCGQPAASRRLDFPPVAAARNARPSGVLGASFLPCNTHVACYIEQLVAGARPASVAQLVEPRFCKPVVVGSSPSASFGTIQAIFAPAGPHLNRFWDRSGRRNATNGRSVRWKLVTLSSRIALWRSRVSSSIALRRST